MPQSQLYCCEDLNGGDPRAGRKPFMPQQLQGGLLRGGAPMSHLENENSPGRQQPRHSVSPGRSRQSKRGGHGGAARGLCEHNFRSIPCPILIGALLLSEQASLDDASGVRVLEATGAGLPLRLVKNKQLLRLVIITSKELPGKTWLRLHQPLTSACQPHA